MKKIAPRNTRDFLIKVGRVSVVVTIALILLRLFFPEPVLLFCEDQAAGRTAVVARGRGTNVSISMSELQSGDHLWSNMFRARDFTCESALGAAWHEQKHTAN